MIGDVLDDAVARLSSRATPEAVHEARKRLKEARALLRLVEPAIGEKARAVRVSLRDTGRQLAAARDAEALVECFDKLQTHCTEGWWPRRFGRLRARLASMRDMQPTPVALEIEAMRSDLLAAGAETAEWAPPAGLAAIEAGLRRTYRDTRRAMQQARDYPSPEAIHEWRKRAKEHWSQLRLIEGIRAQALGDRVEAMRDLSRTLGDHHDLVMMLEASGPLLRPAERRRFDEILLHRLRELEQEAMASGSRLFEAKAGEWSEGMMRS